MIRYQLYLGNGKIKRIKKLKIKTDNLAESQCSTGCVYLALQPQHRTNSKIDKKRQKSCKRKEVFMLRDALQDRSNQVKHKRVEVQVFASEKDQEVCMVRSCSTLKSSKARAVTLLVSDCPYRH